MYLKLQLNTAIQPLLLKVNRIQCAAFSFHAIYYVVLNVCECIFCLFLLSNFSSLLFHAQFVHCMCACASYSFAIYSVPLKEPKWFLLFPFLTSDSFEMFKWKQWHNDWKVIDFPKPHFDVFFVFVSRTNRDENKTSQHTEKNWTFANLANSSKHFVWMFVGIFQFLGINFRAILSLTHLWMQLCSFFSACSKLHFYCFCNIVFLRFVWTDLFEEPAKN